MLMRAMAHAAFGKMVAQSPKGRVRGEHEALLLLGRALDRTCSNLESPVF